MAIDDKFIDQVSRGFVPPLSKALAAQPTAVIAERLFTLPDESVQWIGEGYFVAQLTSWGRPFKSHVQFGASDYRFVFIYNRGLGAGIILSFWFEVDFEGQTWQRGTIGKKEYVALHMQPPQLKKEFLSREMLLTNTAVRTNGKQDKILEIRLSNLKWRNPQTQKFEGGKADNLFQEMMSYYNQRRQVTLRTLMLTMTDPEALETEMLDTEPAEGRAIQVAPPRPETKPVERQAVPPVAPAPPPKPKPAPSAPAAEACPSCGKALSPGAKFCSNCGAQFGEKATPAGAKPEAKPEPKPARPEKSAEPAGAAAASVCPACGKALRPGVMFCGHCGTRLEAKPTKARKKKEPPTCANCGKSVEAGWKACPYCGELLTGLA